MKKWLFVTLLAIAFCGSARADLYVNISTSGGAWPSTPYIIKPLSGAPDWMPDEFGTFCVERFTTFNPRPGDYWATIDDEILNAYKGNPILQDNVKKTYAAFLKGAFDVGFNMNDIQQYIWDAQGYAVTPPSTSVSDSIEAIIGVDDNISGWNNVKTLNLWSRAPYAGDKQSQLVMTPVPGAVLLGMIGLSVAGVRLRKHS